MATIISQRRADGGMCYKALVRIKRDGKLVYSQARTFDKRAVASSWAKRLETELQDPATLERRGAGAGATVGDLIRRYIREVDPVKPLGRTHRFTLEMLEDWPIAATSAAALKASDVVEHCRARQAKGAGPATVLQDLVFLRGPLGMAKVAWNITASPKPLDEARPLLDKLQLVARSHRRDRRPTVGELGSLVKYFTEQDKRSVIPMLDIMEFAIWSAKRMGEICRLRWEDVDTKRRTCLLRDMKDPRHKIGNDFEFPLLGKAWDILQRQPRIDERIFPYDEKSVGARYTRAKRKLGIANLRFHDLRREAASRLFEAGYQIHEVAQVTGHKDLNGLWRTYTKLKPESLHRRPGITLETFPTARGRAHAAHRASAQDLPRELGAGPFDSATPGTSAPATR